MIMKYSGSSGAWKPKKQQIVFVLETHWENAVFQYPLQQFCWSLHNLNLHQQRKNISGNNRSLQHADRMGSLPVPSISEIPAFTYCRHEVVSPSPTSDWKIHTKKADFTPCIYLIFQNNPSVLLDEKKLSLLLIFNLSFTFKLLIHLMGKNSVCFLCAVKIQFPSKFHSRLIYCKMNIQNV